MTADFRKFIRNRSIYTSGPKQATKINDFKEKFYKFLQQGRLVTLEKHVIYLFNQLPKSRPDFFIFSAMIMSIVDSKTISMFLVFVA